MRIAAVTAILAAAAAAQGPQASFRYQAGDVYIAVEHDLQRETDARIGFAIATSSIVERRYTVLAVDANGDARVLVEMQRGPQQLHEYLERGVDRRAEHLAKGFDADSTVVQRVLQAKFTATRFGCEPARDEPAVFYLQELPELLAHVLTLPEGDAAQWRVEPELPRLHASIALQRDGEHIRGDVQLAITDPRVRDGAEVQCPAGEVQWQFDAATGLPRCWRVQLRYPRLPVDRPDQRIVTGELSRSTRLDDEALAQLCADAEAFAVVRDGFFAGRFAAALAAAEAFAAAHPESRLLPAVQAEVAAFRRQVPHYGQSPPEPAVAQAFGGEVAALSQQRGSVVVLDFWATWCVPCIAGMEHLIQRQQQWRGDGLRVFGLTRVDKRQSVDDVRAFAEHGYADGHRGLAVAYPLAVLAGDTLHDWFGIRAIPKLVVLDRDGKVYWEQTGSGGEARLDRVLQVLLRR